MQDNFSPPFTEWIKLGTTSSKSFNCVLLKFLYPRTSSLQSPYFRTKTIIASDNLVCNVKFLNGEYYSWRAKLVQEQFLLEYTIR